MMLEIKGSQFGVEIKDYPNVADQENGKQIQLISEDDENWFKVGNWFSSLWLSDLIQVLQKAQEVVKKS